MQMGQKTPFNDFVSPEKLETLKKMVSSWKTEWEPKLKALQGVAPGAGTQQRAAAAALQAALADLNARYKTEFEGMHISVLDGALNLKLLQDGLQASCRRRRCRRRAPTLCLYISPCMGHEGPRSARRVPTAWVLLRLLATAGGVDQEEAGLRGGQLPQGPADVAGRAGAVGARRAHRRRLSVFHVRQPHVGAGGGRLHRRRVEEGHEQRGGGGQDAAGDGALQAASTAVGQDRAMLR
jgi:hypothetical protein